MNNNYSYYVSYYETSSKKFGILDITTDVPSPSKIWEMLAKKLEISITQVSICNIYPI